MATRSMIGMVQEDGTVRAIYCHFDGYPEGVGRILDANYADANKVEALLDLGNLSALAEEIGEQHPFSTFGIPKADINPLWSTWCLAYGRDRGETGQEAALYSTPNTYAMGIGENGDEYRYLFDGEAWFVLSRYGKFAGKWDDVREALKDAA